MQSLNVENWIKIAALAVSVLGVAIAAANYFAGRRERRRQAERARPRVQVSINATEYDHGWRSVQLHIVPLDDEQISFKTTNWRIDRAILIHPKTAMLARAENDDYATGVFYPEQPVRRIEGRAGIRGQLFALEFFIKFKEPEGGQKATFKVTYSKMKGGGRRSVKVSASAPLAHPSVESPDFQEVP